MNVLDEPTRGESSAKRVVLGGERDGREVHSGRQHSGSKCYAVGGAAGDLGDAVVLECGDWLGLATADGAVVALLPVLVISPREHLETNKDKSITYKSQYKIITRGLGSYWGQLQGYQV